MARRKPEEARKTSTQHLRKLPRQAPGTHTKHSLVTVLGRGARKRKDR